MQLTNLIFYDCHMRRPIFTTAAAFAPRCFGTDACTRRTSTEEHSSAAQRAKLKNVGQAQSVRRLVMGWAAEESGFHSRQESEIPLLYTSSKSVAGPTNPPIQWVPGALSLGREADLWSVSSAEVKNTRTWIDTSRPHSSLWRTYCKVVRYA
jgi:hypothetical protein